MHPHTGTSTSVWMDTARVPEFPVLEESTSANVCVIGAGIAGLSVAYSLVRDGRSVVVIDDGPVASGETERTSAHLTSVMDEGFTALEKMHGKERTRLFTESHMAAINRIEMIAQRESIECDFVRVDGYLFCPPGESTEELEEELQAAKRAGHAGAVLVDRVPMEDFDTGRAIRYPDQAQFHILKYIDGLLRVITANGGRVFAGTRAVDVHGGKDPHVRIGNGSLIQCQSVVIATNAPIHDSAQIYAKQAPYRSYVLGFRIPKHTVARALYWDTLDPYHYIRTLELDDHDVLIVGGEDHKTGHADDAEERFKRLETWTRERFPRATDVLYRWSGQLMEPADGLAMIGRNPHDPDHTYVVTGDSGHGITHGTIAGVLITDLIAGRENPWEKLYDPSRVPAKAGKNLLKDTAGILATFADYLKPGDVRNVRSVPRGQGRILRKGLRKVAAYRDDKGELHEFSAICPHKGCMVRWNSFERSWDCPCHGSRYDVDGLILNGPTIEDLHAASRKA